MIRTRTKDLYVVALSAVDRQGRLAVTPAVTTAVSDRDAESQLDGMLVHRFPLRDGWRQHKASYGRVDERLINLCDYWRG